MQLALTMPQMPARERKTLAILQEAHGAWVSGATFANLHVLSYSQSVGKLRRVWGYRIESTGRGSVARYRLT